MSDDTLRLRSAFLVEQLIVERSEFLVKSQGYFWRIHRHLLDRQCREQERFLENASVITLTSPLGN